MDCAESCILKLSLNPQSLGGPASQPRSCHQISLLSVPSLGQIALQAPGNFCSGPLQLFSSWWVCIHDSFLEVGVGEKGLKSTCRVLDAGG